MANVDFYDDFDFDGLDDFDEMSDFWNVESELEDNEADEWILGAIGGAVGGGAAGAAAGSLLGSAVGNIGFDAADWAITHGAKHLGYDLDDSKAYNYLVRDLARTAITNAVAGGFGTAAAVGGAGAGGVAGAAAPIPEDADPFEPEFSAEGIDQMEALAEEAVAAELEDAIMAADELVSRTFGVMRASPRMLPIMAALRARVHHLIMRARQDPRFQLPARLAPMALRRTVSTLMRLAAARRPVNANMAQVIFARNLAGLMRVPQNRALAVRAALTRARRHRAKQGLPAPAKTPQLSPAQKNALRAARNRAFARQRAMMGR